MIFRDGVYTTDDSSKYAIQGIYFWQVGVLFIVANPSEYFLPSFILIN